MSDPNARRANRLAGESSPYLLLHAHNPVDWYPWGPEALERARREDKPIFLSVGYSTCFWCHVMERESFSDPAIAALMNEEFVNIKVDREERGDLDEIYMLATQVLAGQGGWPNSVFLTPELKPFFAGTYFPPLDARGLPGFPTVLRSMIHAWKERRAEVEEQGEELAGAIRHHLAEIAPFAGPLPGAAPAEKALAALRQRFDATWGGFGGAPKFPTPANLLHLLAFASDPDAATMLAATLDGMARGGIFDQLAGGFHRYSTDREWRVPHFEKMLYDNGLLLEIYARDFERSANPESERVARATASFLAAEMTAPDGGLWSAIDAETGGREGAYYVWTRDEIELALGREESAFLAPILGFDGAPFFEEERYVLHLPRPLEAQARERRTTRAELLAEIEPLRARLLAARFRRRRPATDDKILADWNGIAIAGLAVAGRALAEPAYVERARGAADFVLTRMRTDDGTLLHAWRAGRGRIAAALADYAFLVRGLLRLHEATAEGRWLEAAIALSEEQIRRLGSERGGFFNSAESPDLLVRAKELFDGALPGANAVAAHNLLDVHELTGEGRWLDAAERTARAFTPVVERHPEGAKTMSLALARLGPRPGTAPASPEGAPPLVSIGRGRGAAGASGGGAAPIAAGDPTSLRREAERVVAASARLDSGGELDSGWQPLRVRLAIADGWHLAAASLRVDGIDLELGQLTLPAPAEESAPATGLSQAAYRGAVEIVALARARADLPQALPRILVRYQACDDRRCLPEAALELELGAGGGG